MTTQEERQLVFDYAIKYLEHCENKISTESFKRFCELPDCNFDQETRNKIFLCLVSLIIDNEL